MLQSSLFAQEVPASADDDSEAERQRRLAHFNRDRLAPCLEAQANASGALKHLKLLKLEKEFVAAARAQVAPMLADVPTRASAFVAWFEGLKHWGPGQNDAIFPWLAEEADLSQMRWFLSQEVAGEAGFDDLLAMTQVKMPVRAKLEMARNYWDEMGRGQDKGMHGPMLERLAAYLRIRPEIEETVPEALALGNMMMALATNRAFAFQSIGALGAIELTAPGRASFVSQGLDRLGIPRKKSHYFSLHAVLDVKHSEAWNNEVLAPLVDEDGRRAGPIAEGALLRLWCGKQCFDRYRRHFGLSSREPVY